MSDTFPSTHTAGDSTAWRFDAGDHAPSGGWSAKLVLIGPQRLSVDCAADGEAFALAATAATTAAWLPGIYAARLLYLNGADRASRDLAALEIRPDPAAAGTGAAELLSEAERFLADLEAAYRAHMTSGSAVVGEYRIGTRMRKFKDVSELLKALNAARRDVEAERAAKAIAAGQSPRTRFVVRM